MNALYCRVARDLRQAIVGGTYPTGARLPTEKALQQHYGVSRHTVREALRQLREDNLVTSRQGAGTQVISGATASSDTHDVLLIKDLSLDDLRSWSAGKRFEIEHESVRMIALDKQQAARTGLPSGERWLSVQGTGHEAGSSDPASWAQYYIHRDFSRVGRLLHVHRGPLLPLIEERFGVRIVEVYQEISAALVPVALARVLKVKAHSAALETRRTFRLANGQVALVTVTMAPACRHHLSMTLRRGSA